MMLTFFGVDMIKFSVYNLEKMTIIIFYQTQSLISIAATASATEVTSKQFRRRLPRAKHAGYQTSSVRPRRRGP